MTSLKPVKELSRKELLQMALDAENDKEEAVHELAAHKGLKAIGGIPTSVNVSELSKDGLLLCFVRTDKRTSQNWRLQKPGHRMAEFASTKWFKSLITNAESLEVFIVDYTRYFINYETVYFQLYYWLTSS